MKKFIAGLFIFLFLLLSLFSSGTVDSQDGQLYLAVARYIYYTGQPTAPPYEYNYEGTGKNIHMGTYLGKDGKTYSPTGLGYSLALLPAVALEDLTYKLYGLKPRLEHFPLQSDWPILFFASFSNAFFGAILGIVLFFYLIELGLNKKQSLILTLVSLITTNLWPYTKHSFAHMMFLAFLVLTFYLIKKYSKDRRIKFLVFSGISFGVCALTYNQSFTLSIPALAVYYFLLTYKKAEKEYIKRTFKNFLLFFLSFLPFLAVFAWFENLRFREWTYFGNENFIRQYAVFKNLPVSVFIEGIYGQLFSPGRSIFLYSPILALLIFFHHKIKKNKAEVFAFLILSFAYLIFFASLYVVEEPQYGARGLWDGELSWGPRYLLPLIPFGMLIVGIIYKNLSKLQKIFIFWPFVTLGIYINFLGVSLPYQLKLHNLEPELFLNGQKYTSFSYANLLPRHTPVLSMSKEFYGHIKSLPGLINPGKYGVNFYDGAGLPFSVGSERWRSLDGNAYISFNDPDGDIEKIELNIINHPAKEASTSALALGIGLNGQRLQTLELKASERKTLSINFPDKILKTYGNVLTLNPVFSNPKALSEKSQIAGIVSMSINGKTVNMERINLPFVSDIARKNPSTYRSYGGDISNPWIIWELRTQVYERTPDFWWIKPLFYWDLPARLFLVLFLGNIFCLIIAGRKVFEFIKTDAKPRL